MTNPTTDITAQNFVLTGSRDPLDLAKFNMALKHLSTDPATYSNLLSAADRGANLTINHSGLDLYDPNTNTVFWDPTRAIVSLHPDYTPAGVISPEMALIHEIAHLLDPDLAGHSMIPDTAWENGGERFAAAIIEHAGDNPACIVVDSLSDEHDGEGGMLERHEQVIDQMAGDQKGNWSRRDALSQAAWARVKPFRNQLITRLLHVTVPLILTFRAREKIKPIKQQKDGREITVPTNVGFQAIAPAEIVKCLTCVCLLPQNAEGKAVWKSSLATEDFLLKRPYFLADILKDGIIDETMGERLAIWAAGGGPVSTTATAPETAANSQTPPTPPGEPAGGLVAAVASQDKGVARSPDHTAPPAGIDESERIDRLDAQLASAAECGMDYLQVRWSAIAPADQKILKAALDRRHKPAAAAVDAARAQPETTGELPL